MSDLAIAVEKLGKKYYIGRSKSINSAIASRLYQEPGAGADQILWALRDVSFDVGCSEVVGIVGGNGSGKSTLLKILSSITSPTTGQAKMVGRCASLIEVGTGFHGELTGRENVYVNGAILGMTKREVAARFDEIVDFSGIERFIDMPVKRYSSGMSVRLAFAVAAHLEPEILMLDEVLAVGDASFQKKCLGKMNDAANSGRTVLFVSHDTAAIGRLCKRVIWLDKGILRADGASEETLSSYLTSAISLNGCQRWEDDSDSANQPSHEMSMLEISIRDSEGRINSVLDRHKPFSLQMQYRLNVRVPFLQVGFVLSTEDDTVVFEAYDGDDDAFVRPRAPGVYTVNCHVPAGLLNQGRYLISMNAYIPEVPEVKCLVRTENVLGFDVEDMSFTGFQTHSARQGVIRPVLNWHQESFEEFKSAVHTVNDCVERLLA